ncbi:MAG: PHP domain-containing protein [Candidatus Micrarchaeota archaeon]
MARPKRRGDQLRLRPGFGVGAPDLHLHSTLSDGARTPHELIDTAHGLRLPLVAVTDHHTFEGSKLAEAAGEKRDVAVVPGSMEVNARHLCLQGRKPKLAHVHLLAYFTTPQAQLAVMTHVGQARSLEVRNVQKALEEFRQAGFRTNHIRLDDLPRKGLTGTNLMSILFGVKQNRSVTGNAARRLIAHYGRVKTFNSNVDAAQFISTVNKHGGFVVLAHPSSPHYTASEEVILDLVDAGLAGIEVMHPDHTPGETKRLIALAQKTGCLVPTIGSDFHTREQTVMPGVTRDTLRALARKTNRKLLGSDSELSERLRQLMREKR